jgi:acylphosphatase
MAMHCIVKGKVQGVWFRQSTLEQARALGLTGWVRNNDNGEVELLVCGEEPAINNLTRWLWQGPKHANVQEVIVEEVPQQTFDQFTIKY